WDFAGSIYFGCREPHLPLEFGYARQLLEAAGHEVFVLDAQLERLDDADIRANVTRLAPDLSVVTTAPSYLFWRCAPPELRVPQQSLAALSGIDALTVAVGPHASTTPRIALKKLDVDAAVQGECEEVLVRLAETPREGWGEIAGLVAAGATYVYCIDEIFLPWRELLEAVAERPVEFGIQTRIDLWRPDMLDLLGSAGCVSIEAGVESLTPAGRDWLDKDCKLSTEELRDRLLHAKRSVPFVQANLIMTEGDDPEAIARWREQLQRHGVWANEPVPLFPYPGSPEYRRIWGLPDDDAWERALDYYLDRYSSFSDIQEARPRRLAELEIAAG